MVYSCVKPAGTGRISTPRRCFCSDVPSPGSGRTSVIASFPTREAGPLGAEVTGGADARKLHSLFGPLLG